MANQLELYLSRSMICVCMVFMIALPAECGRMARYDLDSMVLMSEAVVEGTIIREKDADQREQSRLKAVKVYKGDFKKDDIIKVSMSLYRKPVTQHEFGKSLHLETGDRVIAFLVNVQWSPPRPDVFQPIGSGVRFISNGKVIGFSQPDSSGPALLQSDELYSKYWTTVDRFKTDLEKSMEKVRPIEEKFRAEFSEKDVDWLMDLLRERSPEDSTYPRYTDHISELACERIARIQDPEVSARALRYAKSWGGVSAIRRSFGTPRGRDFLLSVIADPDEQMDKRATYAEILADAGESYHRTRTFVEQSGGWQTSGKPRDGNAGYITGIARLALGNVEHEELCAALMRSMASFGRRIAQRKEEHTSADISAAMPILKSIYDSTESEYAKYHIEITSALIDKAAYRRLNSKCGPIVSIMRQLEVHRRDDRERSLQFGYTVYGFADGPIELTPYIVFEDTVSENVYHLSLWENRRHASPRGPEGNEETRRKKRRKFDGTVRRGTGGSIILPKHIPNGRYRVYIEYRDGKAVISKGHYAELEI